MLWQAGIIMIKQQLSVDELTGLLTLGFNDTCRQAGKSCEVVHLSFLERCWRGVQEFFGCKKHIEKDQQEMSAFYARIKENIKQLNLDLSDRSKLDKTIPAIQTMLRVHAKVANSLWGQNMRILRDENYNQFTQAIETLQRAAKDQIARQKWVNSPEQAQIARWMTAKIGQRRFAAYKNLNNVPYQYGEIPVGAVMMTNPKSYILGAIILKDQGLSFGSYFKLFTGAICKWKTGRIHNHAQLALGNNLGKSETFDLDKSPNSSIRGKITIQQRDSERIFYGDIAAPNEKEMLDAYHKAYPTAENRCDHFSQLWAKIEREARGNGLDAQAAPLAIASVVRSTKRPKDYNCKDDWKPGEKQYGCSATVAALFSHFGIDIGAQFDKVTRNISPGDYLRSKFFTPLYIS